MVAVSASLVGDSYPQAVQVVITGLVVGDTFEITGQSGSFVWPVRAGEGVADSTQVVRNDLATPVNAVLTYTVLVNGVTAVTSAPLTVPFTGPNSGVDGGRYLMSSLNGDFVAVWNWQDSRDSLEWSPRVALFEIPGRARPVAMYDVPIEDAGQIVARTRKGSETDTLKALLRTGAPVMVRTDGAIQDLPAVFFAIFTRIGSQRTVSLDVQREWTLGYTRLDDPEPNTLAVVSTWDDFDAAYGSLMWSDFDTEWVGGTWDGFDIEDWASRA